MVLKHGGHDFTITTPSFVWYSITPFLTYYVPGSLFEKIFYFFLNIIGLDNYEFMNVDIDAETMLENINNNLVNITKYPEYTLSNIIRLGQPHQVHRVHP